MHALPIAGTVVVKQSTARDMFAGAGAQSMLRLFTELVSFPAPSRLFPPPPTNCEQSVNRHVDNFSRPRLLRTNGVDCAAAAHGSTIYLQNGATASWNKCRAPTMFVQLLLCSLNEVIEQCAPPCQGSRAHKLLWEGLQETDLACFARPHCHTQDMHHAGRKGSAPMGRSLIVY